MAAWVRRLAVLGCLAALALDSAPAAAQTDGSADTLARARRRREWTPRPRGPRMPEKMPAATRASAVPGERPTALPVARDDGEYGDSLELLAPAVAEFERTPAAGYAYCLRVTALYEQVYYGEDGELHRTYKRAEHHGTAFAYRQKDGEYFLATNEHVAQMPDVTTEESAPQGIAPGSRKVREAVHIVRDQRDDDVTGFIPLTRVLVDKRTDFAIFKTRHKLNVMPYRLGRSAGLRVGNVLLGKGFPLGVAASSNVGRVTNARQVDLDGNWRHTDFLTDAALNGGNSGSPVFAISRKTRELELVGIFHATFKDAQGMGVVVGVDDVREMLETLKLPAERELVVPSRDVARQRLGSIDRAFYFPFGGATARADMLDGGVQFDVLPEFPMSEQSRVRLYSRDGDTVLQVDASGGVSVSALEGETQRYAQRLETELWRALALTQELRRLEALGEPPGPAKPTRDLRRELTVRAATQKDLLSAVDFVAEAPEFRKAKARTSEPAP